MVWLYLARCFGADAVKQLRAAGPAPFVARNMAANENLGGIRAEPSGHTSMLLPFANQKTDLSDPVQRIAFHAFDGCCRTLKSSPQKPFNSRWGLRSTAKRTRPFHVASFRGKEQYVSGLSVQCLADGNFHLRAAAALFQCRFYCIGNLLGRADGACIMGPLSVSHRQADKHVPIIAAVQECPSCRNDANNQTTRTSHLSTVPARLCENISGLANPASSMSCAPAPAHAIW